MRLVCLNVWRGKLLDQLIAFAERESPATDVFCFQEMVSSVRSGSAESDVFSALRKILPDFSGYFEPAEDYPDGTQMGLAMFVRKRDAVEREGDFFVYRTRDALVGDDGRTLGKNIQFAELADAGKEFTVMNFHGLWSGADRNDSSERIAESKNVKKFMDGFSESKIVCGDFNLTLGTESLGIIDAGMRNLIKEYGITSTRPEKFFPYPDKYCDYILVDRDVKVADFKVLADEVSDHLPLAVTFEI